MKIDHIVVFDLLKRSTSLDIVFGAQNLENRIHMLTFFAHISRLVMIQRQKFGVITVFDLVNILNNLDLDLYSRV